MPDPRPFTERTLPSHSRRRLARNLGGRQRSVLSAGSLILLTALLVAAATLPRTGAAFTDTTGNTSNAWSADSLDAPTMLTATGGGDVTLSWTASADTYATGHRIFRATSSGGPYTQIAQVTPRTTTSYLDSPAAGTYYYVVRAYSSGWESTNSNQVVATVTSVSLADSWQTGLTHVAGSGSNRALVFVATNEEQSASIPTLSSVSYGGRPLTKVVAESVANGCCSARVEVWILDAAGLAAASGSGVSVSWSSAPDTPLYSHAVFRNVDQSMPIGATTSASVTGDTPNPVPLASVATSNKDMVIGAASAGETGSYTAQNSFTLGSTQSTSTGGTTAHGSAYKLANGSNETVSLLFNPSNPPWTNRQVAVAMVLNVAS